MHRSLLTVAHAVLQSRSTEELARVLFGVLVEVTGLESFFLSRVDVGANAFEIFVSHNARRDAVGVPEGLTLAWTDSVCQHALAASVHLTQNADGLWNHVRVVHDLNIRTYVVEPLRDPAGAVVGTLCGVSDRRTDVDADGLLLLDFCGRLLADRLRRDQGAVGEGATVAARLSVGALPTLASEHGLEAALTDILATTVHKGGVACVVCLGLKAVDAQNRAEAIEPHLVEIVRRLTEALHADETVARYGEREFVAVTRLPRKAGRAAAAAFGERLTAALWDPFGSGTEQARIDVRCGSAVATNGEDAPTLVARARDALRLQGGPSGADSGLG